MQVKIKIERKLKTSAVMIPLPGGVAKTYMTIVLPYWIADIMSRRIPWANIDSDEICLKRLQYWYDHCLGDTHPHEIVKNSDAYKKVWQNRIHDNS